MNDDMITFTWSGKPNTSYNVYIGSIHHIHVTEIIPWYKRVFNYFKEKYIAFRIR